MEKRIALIAGAGCLLLVLFLVVAIPVALLAPVGFGQRTIESSAAVATTVIEAMPVQTPVPQPTEPRLSQQTQPSQQPRIGSDVLTELYGKANPGVVNIEVEMDQGMLSGQGAGSGFILDNDGHIVTNNHVVAHANRVIVVFYNGIEVEAEIIGTDADSDLAVVKVDELVEGAHPLPLGDSDQVQAGEWVVAIGNPFQYGGSMTIGIVSAVGRTIPSGLTPFSIPQAIQTDAAINPGNSGGPLLNLKGEVIGVNAQIRSSGARANAGVGFAIPSSVVQFVISELIENGSYIWPWLGVGGRDVSLVIQELNNLETQEGAYIDEVYQGGPADKAGLQGSRDLDQPIGGDVIIEADAKRVTDFSDLLVDVAFKKPGDKMELTILRNGQRQQVTAILAPRPENLNR